MGTPVLKKLSTALALAMMIALGSSTSAVRGSTRFSYTVTELGNLPGYTDSVVTGINDLGQAVGFSSLNNRENHAFLWENGKMTDLGTLGGRNSSAYGINNKGQVVGDSDISNDKSPVFHAFLWENGKMTDLGTLGGKRSRAHALNDKGQVVGFSEASDGTNHAFLWENGKMTDLGTLGDPASYATGINNKGQVVGISLTSGSSWHAFLWENGKMKGLGDLGGGSSFANGINDKGQVVGYSDTQQHIDHCVLWSGGTILDTSPRLKSVNRGCFADRINNQGTFVGAIETRIFSYNSVYHFFVGHDGKRIDLDKTVLPVNSVAPLESVEGINNKGQIVVNGLDQTERAYLLTPTWVTQ